MQPKKSLGQNFLRDEKILQKIVDFAQIKNEDVVLEVGPGEGALTKLLLEKAGKVIAVEKDEELANKLPERFKSEIASSKLKILSGDILDIENLLEIAKLKIENYCLVGNIPYNITGAIFKKFLSTEHQPKSITFVIQKEVAKRIVGTQNSKNQTKGNILRISIEAYGKPYFGGIIKAGSFFPAPKVDSAIIAIREINKSNFIKYNVSEDQFFAVLRAGFAHPRKFLISNLKTILNIPKFENEVFVSLGISLKSRAEDLELEDWFRLSRAIYSNSKNSN